MKLSREKRDRLILVAVVTVVVAAGLWTLVIGPQNTTRAANRTTVEELEKKIAGAQSLLKRAHEIATDYTRKQAQLDAIEKELAPDANAYFWMFRLATEAVKTSPVEFGDLTQPLFLETQVLSAFPYKSVAFTLTYHGHYHELGHLLAELENGYPHLRFQLVGLRPVDPPRPEQPELLTLQLKVTALVKPALALR